MCDGDFRSSLKHRHQKTAAMWNLALDGSGGPELPGADSCIGGCRGVVTVNSNGSYMFVSSITSFDWLADMYFPRISVNQECESRSNLQ